MGNQWGNTQHGPGGDPSWLGGKDRGDGGSQSSGGWSSDFAGGAQSPDSDFGGGDFGGGRDARAAEQMAPQFGDSVGDDARTEGSASPWLESFTGQQSEGSGNRRSGFSRILGAVVPIFVLVIFGVFFIRFFSGFSFGGFGSWWILLFIGIPILSRLVRMIRKHLGE